MVSARILLVVACAAMLALAGCSGGPGTSTTATSSTGGPTTTTTGSTSATSVTTSTTTSSTTGATTGTTTGATTTDDSDDSDDTGFVALETPSWLTADGVDATRLVTAHRESLAGSSHRVRAAQRASGVYSLVQWTTMRVGADGQRLYDVRTRTGDVNTSSRAFVNDTWVVLERSNETRTTYSDYRVGSEASPFDVTGQAGEYVRLGDFAVNRTYEADGEPRIEYVATAAADVDAARGISAYRGRLVVSPDGRIHELAVDVSQESQYGNVTTTFTFELAGVGDVDASTPSWVETARERTTTVDFAYDYANGVIEITHDGGDVVPAGTEVVVVSAAGRGAATAELPSSFAPGDTLYVTRGDGRNLNVAFGSRPSGDGDFDGRVRVEMYGSDGEIVVRKTLAATANASAVGTSERSTEAPAPGAFGVSTARVGGEARVVPVDSPRDRWKQNR